MPVKKNAPLQYRHQCTLLAGPAVFESIVNYLPERSDVATVLFGATCLDTSFSILTADCLSNDTPMFARSL